MAVLDLGHGRLLGEGRHLAVGARDVGRDHHLDRLLAPGVLDREPAGVAAHEADEGGASVLDLQVAGLGRDREVLARGLEQGLGGRGLRKLVGQLHEWPSFSIL